MGDASGRGGSGRPRRSEGVAAGRVGLDCEDWETDETGAWCRRGPAGEGRGGSGEEPDGVGPSGAGLGRSLTGGGGRGAELCGRGWSHAGRGRGRSLEGRGVGAGRRGGAGPGGGWLGLCRRLAPLVSRSRVGSLPSARWPPRHTAENGPPVRVGQHREGGGLRPGPARKGAFPCTWVSRERAPIGAQKPVEGRAEATAACEGGNCQDPQARTWADGERARLSMKLPRAGLVSFW